MESLLLGSYTRLSCTLMAKIMIPPLFPIPSPPPGIEDNFPPVIISTYIHYPVYPFEIQLSPYLEKIFLKRG